MSKSEHIGTPLDQIIPGDIIAKFDNLTPKEIANILQPYHETIIKIYRDGDRINFPNEETRYAVLGAIFPSRRINSPNQKNTQRRFGNNCPKTQI
jgi:hypothetical protein